MWSCLNCQVWNLSCQQYDLLILAPKPKTSCPTSKLYKPTRVNKLTPQKEINSNHKSSPFQLLIGSLLIDAFDKDAKLLLEFSKYPYQICLKIRKIEMADTWCQLYSLHKDQCF